MSTGRSGALQCRHSVNGLALRAVDKASVLDRLPPKVREHYERFSTCDTCGRVYWEGSHWRNMRRVLDGVLANKGGT